MLNSNCDVVSCAAGSAQEQWLRSDLAATTRPCVDRHLAPPAVLVGHEHGNTPRSGRSGTRCRTYGVEIELAGHEHSYERFAPQTGERRGERERASRSSSSAPAAGASTRSAPRCRTAWCGIATFGVLKLTLGDRTYSWQFVDQNGSVLDSGTGACH